MGVCIHPYLFIPPIECSTGILKELITLLFNISESVRGVFPLLLRNRYSSLLKGTQKSINMVLVLYEPINSTSKKYFSVAKSIFRGTINNRYNRSLVIVTYDCISFEISCSCFSIDNARSFVNINPIGNTSST